ncbi:hypothetical protein NWP10_09645 [Micrococcus sp. HG099]|uniref:general stress protein n=1 Tax=Micrococcus sp. HG099 TaxID=2969755 RepID=UPI00215B4F56|nr:general stress protein [Micrococcus sp. HG099]MCR8676066.1 hypothetical protein [Micrococcus sp. HG099]
MSQQQPYAQDPHSAAPATTLDAAYAGGPLGAADHRVLESVPDYARAQAIVDQLSDAGFPVEHVRIVGTGLRTVEQILGRMTTGKAAGRGAVQGLWFGLLLGLLFSIFSPGFGFLWILLIALGLGALWGAVFGATGHAATSAPCRPWTPPRTRCRWRPPTSIGPARPWAPARPPRAPDPSAGGAGPRRPVWTGPAPRPGPEPSGPHPSCCAHDTPSSSCAGGES